MSDNKKIFKLSLLGETEVGKTSMANMKLNKKFNQTKIATLGIDITSDTAEIEGKNCIFSIYDTAGQERFESVSGTTIKVCDGFILVYAVNKKKTLKKIEKWISFIKENSKINEKALILVGNKIDIVEREVTKEEGEEFAKQCNLEYFETSAKTGENIEKAFNCIYEKLYNLKMKPKEEKNNQSNAGNNKVNEKNQNVKIDKEKTIDKGKKKRNWWWWCPIF